MAFKTTITDTHTRRTIENAYCRAVIAKADSKHTTLLISVWESEEARQQHPDNPIIAPFTRVLATDPSLANSNPLDYGYKLLQASGEFTNATWGI